MKKSKIFLFIILLAALIFPLFVTNSYIISILCITLIYALSASGWNIISGICGQVGFGNSLFFALGAYVTAALFVFYGLNPWLAMLVGAVIVATISVLLGFVTFPLSGVYYSLATVALLEILRLLFYDQDRIFGIKFGGGAGIIIPWKGGGFLTLEFVDKRMYYYLLLILLVLVLIFTSRLVKRKTGFYYRAISTNETAASTMGINVLEYKCLAQFTSAFIMSCCGSIYVMYTMFIEPNSIFSFDMALYMLLMAVIGGLGTVYGPTLGAVLLMPLSEILRSRFGTMLPGISAVTFGVILILCMQFFPEGIIPMTQHLISNKRNNNNDRSANVLTKGEIKQ